MRLIERIVGCSVKLLYDVVAMYAAYCDANVHPIKAQNVQCDEIWSFCNARATNVNNAVSAPEGAGDAAYATEFVKDVGSRLSHRVQLATDGHKAYLKAVGTAFGYLVDYAQLVKIYAEQLGKGSDRRYSSADFVHADKVAASQ